MGVGKRCWLCFKGDVLWWAYCGCFARALSAYFCSPWVPTPVSSIGPWARSRSRPSWAPRAWEYSGETCSSRATCKVPLWTRLGAVPETAVSPAWPSFRSVWSSVGHWPFCVVKLPARHCLETSASACIDNAIRDYAQHRLADFFEGSGDEGRKESIIALFRLRMANVVFFGWSVRVFSCSAWSSPCNSKTVPPSTPAWTSVDDGLRSGSLARLRGSQTSRPWQL